ncbi:hypothetical protein A6X20_13435 [Bradyrhizobium elkanii]|nr:hypothetical protein A6452_07345 [Bradyrhizobium elkanii]ODM84917.1 hypothetical protein A6X20_13435 [Bradyrhizobium elkanii]
MIAGAVVGGLASSAYGYPGYAYGYGYPGYGYGYGYSPAYYGYGGYAYDDGYYAAPYRWGGGYTTTYYSGYRPAYYGYRYRHVVRPAYAYYRGGYPRWHHRWRHW